MKKITLLLAMLFASISFGQVVINELDADQTSTDTEEFVELKSTNGNESLDGLVVVFFNGSSDLSYDAFDLTGFTTDADGYLILGSDAISGADISLGADNGLQNGADAVAIYMDDISSWPNDTPPTTTNLIDAIVYGTNDDDDVDLLAALGQTVQYDEDLNGEKDTESLQRRPDNTFCTALPTLRAENVCSACTFAITDISGSCDAVTSGQDSTTLLLEFIGGGTETYTVQITSGGGVVGGDDPTTTENGTIEITGVSEGVTITVSITSTNCTIEQDVFAPDCVPAIEVSTIAELRAGTEGEIYRLTGEAILTFQQSFRNQKFIEDDTAAILIDDSNNTITTVYALGDGLTDVEGFLGSFNGMMQFNPTLDPGAPSSSGTDVFPTEISMTDLNADPDSYESEYVRIVPQVDVDNTITTWETGQEYPLTNADGTFTFRTSFFDADYIGLDVPTVPVFVAGIITERDNGSYFITARDANDIVTELGIGDNNANVFAVFPNPTNGNVNITSQFGGAIEVAVFDMLGKEVLTTSGNAINASALSSGMYILKLTQGNIVATKKLVVR